MVVGATSATDGIVLSDARLEPFQRDDFDPTEFTSRALSGAQASAQSTTQELRDGIQNLETGIRSEVLRKQADLMRVVRNLSDTEVKTRGVETSVHGMQGTVGQLRVALLEPCDHIRTKTRQLKNLRDAVDLLRHVNHRLKLTQRLRTQIEEGQKGGSAPTPDTAQAAKLLTEIEATGRDVDISGIEILESDSEFLRSTASRVRFQAEEMLRQGLNSLNQADVGNALQVYFNLEELPSAIESLVAKEVSDLKHKAKQALDLRQALTGASSTGAGGWQEAFWSRVRELANHIEKSAVGIWHLEQVVWKKRDPITHIQFHDVVMGDSGDTILARYWRSMTKAFGSVFGEVVHPSRPATVREALTQGFPTLAGILEAMFERLAKQCQSKGAPLELGKEHLDSLMAACQPIQNAYLTGSLSRMTEAVSVAFPGGTRNLPLAADVQQCIATMHEELKAVGGSLHVAALVASTVGKAVLLLAERVDMMASAGSEVRTMGGGCTSAQSRNIALCSHLQEVHRSLVSAVPNLPLTAAEALVHPMEFLKGAAIETIAPIFKAVVETVEQAILEIHATSNNWGEDSGESTQALPSKYVSDLEAKLQIFRSEFLMKFTPVPNPTVPSFTISLVQRMACRVMVYFVRHASMIRPLGRKGRLQLSKDVLAVQSAVRKYLFPVEKLGMPFRSLRAFRALLAMEISDIAGAPLLKEMPRIVALYHLYSRAPPGLVAPHSRTGLSPSQYSLWLDTHSAEEAVTGVKTALEACPTKAKSHPNFEQVFPVMMELCDV
ncbi:hypothetical protein BSKO_03878 [Bryopsis sp. KO-2023]|nr:hypothetical protein BSKO_03878 [Bryopsis sp. KO-2023]